MALVRALDGKPASRLVWAPPWDGEAYAPWLGTLGSASGAYLIRDRATHAILYVGESHKDRLRKTILRHFEAWSGPTAGTGYDRRDVELAIIVCRAGAEAVELQYALIELYRPRDNTYGVGGANEEESDVPF